MNSIQMNFVLNELIAHSNRKIITCCNSNWNWNVKIFQQNIHKMVVLCIFSQQQRSAVMMALFVSANIRTRNSGIDIEYGQE